MRPQHQQGVVLIAALQELLSLGKGKTDKPKARRYRLELVKQIREFCSLGKGTLNMISISIIQLQMLPASAEHDAAAKLCLLDAAMTTLVHSA